VVTRAYTKECNHLTFACLGRQRTREGRCKRYSDVSVAEISSAATDVASCIYIVLSKFALAGR
jgi:hypothetical protein